MGLFKLLFTGEDDAADLDRLDRVQASLNDESADDELAADQFARESELFADKQLAEENVAGGYEPETSIRKTLAHETAAVRQRDELTVQVGSLFLTVESLLRLLKEKNVIDDLDLRRMTQKVDLEDGVPDGEYHPHQPLLPAHCPKCEARLNPGKRMCLLCGHRFGPE